MNVENEKCVIVVDENLPLGIIANTAAILGITMGMRAISTWELYSFPYQY